MALRIVKAEPFDLVVFGGTGDLLIESSTRRSFAASAATSSPSRLGSSALSRRHLGREAFRASVKDTLMKFHVIDNGASAATERFLSRLDYVSVDATRRGMGGPEGAAWRR